jgi:hypothetical protein
MLIDQSHTQITAVATPAKSAAAEAGLVLKVREPLSAEIGCL